MPAKGQYKSYGMIKSLYGNVPIIHATDAMMRKRGYIHIGYTTTPKNYYMYNVYTDGVQYYATLDKYYRRDDYKDDYERSKPKRRLSKSYPKRHFVTDNNSRVLKTNIQESKNQYKRVSANYNLGRYGVTKADVERSFLKIGDAERQYRLYVMRKYHGWK